MEVAKWSCQKSVIFSCSGALVTSILRNHQPCASTPCRRVSFCLSRCIERLLFSASSPLMPRVSLIISRRAIMLPRMSARAVFRSAHSGFGYACGSSTASSRNPTAFSLPSACSFSISPGDPPNPARFNKCRASLFVQLPVALGNIKIPPYKYSKPRPSLTVALSLRCSRHFPYRRGKSILHLAEGGRTALPATMFRLTSSVAVARAASSRSGRGSPTAPLPAAAPQSRRAPGRRWRKPLWRSC